MDHLLKNTHSGLTSALTKLVKVKTKINKIVSTNKQLQSRDKDDCFRAEEAKARLNENYILIAKLSSENLRLLGEVSKLETAFEDMKVTSHYTETRLQEEQCAFNMKIIGKDKEIEKLQLKICEFERQISDLNQKVEHFQDKLSASKMSPDTSASSFDFYPTSSGHHTSTGSYREHGFRPRAFSAVSSDSSKLLKIGRGKTDPKLTDVSSPDLGVESDLYSSLERGNTSRGEKKINYEKIIN